VYAGSSNELALALAQTGGGAVRTAFQAPITSAGSPFGQKIEVDIPASVQSPAAGLYSYITSVSTTIGAKFTKKVKGKKKNFYFASLNGCPTDRTHDAGVQLTYVQNDAGPGGTSDIAQDTADCRK
jgi:hypothetical protein